MEIGDAWACQNKAEDPFVPKAPGKCILNQENPPQPIPHCNVMFSAPFVPLNSQETKAFEFDVCFDNLCYLVCPDTNWLNLVLPINTESPWRMTLVDPHFCDGSYTSQSVDPHFTQWTHTSVMGPIQVSQRTHTSLTSVMGPMQVTQWTHTFVMGPIQVSQWTHTSVMGPIQVNQWTHTSVMGPIHSLIQLIEHAWACQKNLKTPFCP